MPSVETIRPLRVAAPGTSELKISARGPNTIFYGDNAQVSSVNKIGNLASGESLTIKTKPVWFLAEATPALIDFEEKETLGAIVGQKGIAGGVAELNSSGYVPNSEKPLPINLAEYLGNPAYVSDSAALEAAIAEGASFILPKSGTYNIENVTASKALTFIGGDPRNLTFNSPTGEPILTITGGLSEATDTCTIGGFRVTCTANTDYDKPLISLVKMRGVKIRELDANVSGTCTLLRFDTTYNSSIEKCTWRNGRYAVPFEVVNVSVAQQMDTISMTNVIMSGTHGPIVRTATGGLHGITFKQTKVAANAPDFGSYAESKLVKEAKAAETSLELKAGDGVKFAANDPVYIDFGDSVEINKVSSVAVDVLNLVRPLKYTHVVETQVVAHGFAYSLGTCTGVSFDTIHQEGMPTGIMTGTTTGIRTLGTCFSSAGEFMRVCGQTQDVDIGMYVAAGDETTARNYGVYTPAQNVAAWIRVDLNGPIILVAGAPALTQYSASLTSKEVTAWQNSSGYVYRLRYWPSGQGTQTAEETAVGNAESYRRFANGAWRISGDVGFERATAKVGKITDGGTTNLGTLANKLIDVNTAGKTSAEITTALPAGVTVSADLMIADKTNNLLLLYSGTKWFKSAALTEIV